MNFAHTSIGKNSLGETVTGFDPTRSPEKLMVVYFDDEHAFARSGKIFASPS